MLRRSGPWSVLVPILLALLVGVACSSVSEVTSVSGTPEEQPGLYLYESLCATCHGNGGAGGTGPALAGHSAEQVVRQVRAPVGDMPMFPPDKIMESGLDALLEYVHSLESGDHGGHAHSADVMSGQDRSQILHAIALHHVHDGALEEAAHLSRHGADLVVGTHRDAMEELATTIDSGDDDRAAELLTAMAPVGELTEGRTPVELLLLMVVDELARDDLDAARHWAEHASDGGDDAAQALHVALAEGDLAGARELLARMGAELPHEEEGEHHDDEGGEAHDEDAGHDEDEAEAHDEEDGHHDGEEAEAHDEEDGHHDDEEAEAHDEDDGHHDDEPDGSGEVEEPAVAEPVEPDHDDTGSEPHDH